MKILVVDDDLNALRTTERLLRFFGATVCSLSSSLEAAERIDQQRFDGMFLDVSMPEMDGLELTRRVRHSTLNADTVIVVVSGGDAETTMKKAYAAGASFFLHKPFDHRQLTHLLNMTRGTMLAERRQHRRVALVTEISCQLGSEKFTAQSERISEGGMSLTATRALPEGKKVSLAFALPDRASSLQTTGIVLAVVDSNRASLRFEEIKAEDKQLIREFVAGQPEIKASS
jgi:CheY-like chemotaxis protein